jgi:hypothetical protein
VKTEGFVGHQFSAHCESCGEQGKARDHKPISIEDISCPSTYKMTTPRGSSSGGIFLSDFNLWVMVCASNNYELRPGYRCSTSVNSIPLCSSSCSSHKLTTVYNHWKPYLRSKHHSRVVERSSLPEGVLTESWLLHGSCPQRLHSEESCSIHRGVVEEWRGGFNCFKVTSRML